MEGLLPALGSAFQLLLGHLWGTLLVVCESWTHESRLPAFPWEILVCATVLVLTVKRWHSVRTVKATVTGTKSSVCGKRSENVGPRAQADEALKPPRVEASPPTLKTLCFSAINDPECTVSLARPEEEQQVTARPPREDPQRREELPGPITPLHNSHLASEIHVLRRKVQSLPDVHDRHVRQLHIRLFHLEARCLQSKNKLAKVLRELNADCQIRNLARKIAGDLREELAQTTAYHRQEVRLCEERAQQSWEAAVRMERALSELTRENTRLRQLLAQVESNSQLSPRGLPGPAAPPAAHRGLEGSGEPLGHEAPAARGRGQP